MTALKTALATALLVQLRLAIAEDVTAPQVPLKIESQSLEDGLSELE